jgi:CDP-diacylglycerol--glycerol-3-phosphate 3-phosphatidyltransferase
MVADFRRTLPNALTVTRLVVAGAFFATITLTLRMGPHPDRAVWGNAAMALFIVAASTDFLDGYLARRWNATSLFGRIMDPFVDKVLVLGAFVFLASPRFAIPESESYERFTSTTGVHSWMVVVILARELMVTSIRGVVESLGIAFGADGWGKAKMVLQSIAVPTALFVAVNEPLLASASWRGIRDAVVWAAVAVTVVSCIPYLLRARHLLACERGS